MPVNCADWAETFSTLPRWACPTCLKSHLSPRDKKLHAESRGELAQQLRPTKSGSSKRLVCLLECNHCQELVTICGDGHPDEGIRVVSIYPPVMPISLPGKIPRAVRDNVVSAAQLFWSDHNAAAVRLRQAIERTLDDHNIALEDDQGRKIDLGARVASADNQVFTIEIKDLIRCIKEAGDIGAHQSHLSRADVLTSFDAIETALHYLYDRASHRVIQEARAAHGKMIRRRHER
jgi:Domain of unknown function (DUF4145)